MYNISKARLQCRSLAYENQTISTVGFQKLQILLVPSGRHGKTEFPIMITTNHLRHSLINSFDAISHGKLVDDLLWILVEVDLPSVITTRRG